MRVLMLEPSGGNIAQYAASLARELHALGVDTTLLTSLDFDCETWAQGMRVQTPYPRYLPDTSRILRLPDYLALLIQLCACILRTRPDVVHVQWFKLACIELPLLRVATRLARARLVYTAHDLLPHEPKPGDCAVYHTIYRLVDAVIVHSPGLARELHCQFRVPASKIFASVLGSYARFRERYDCTRADGRSKLQLDQHETVFLLFGSLMRYKGVDILLDALVHLRNTALTILVVGQPRGRDAPYLLRRLSSLDSKSDTGLRVRHVVGFVPDRDIPTYFRAADCVLLPYRKVYGSAVAMNAFGYGRPVIATRTGFLPEVVLDGTTGLLIPPGDSGALADAMHTLHRDVARWREREEVIRQYYDEHYSWTLAAERTLDAYSAALMSRPR